MNNIFDDYLYQIEQWKKRFSKKNTLQNIKKIIETKKSEQTNNEFKLVSFLKKDFLNLNSNIYYHSFEKFIYLYKNPLNETNFETVLFYSHLNESEINHIINFYFCINNFLSYYFPTFFPFFYGTKELTNELLFQKINYKKLTLKEFLSILNEVSLQKYYNRILKVIFHQLFLLNRLFKFTHYSFGLDEILITISEKNLSNINESNSMDLFNNFYLNYDIISTFEETSSKKCFFEEVFSLSSSINNEQLPFTISLNIFSSNIKDCFFILENDLLNTNQMTFSSLYNENLEDSIKNKLIKFDRDNILTDVFNILKQSLILFENKEVSLIENFFSYFSEEDILNENIKEKIFKIHNLPNMYNISIEEFLEKNFKKENSNDNYELYFNTFSIYSSIFSFYDFITKFENVILNSNKILENICLDYIKNFHNSHFMNSLNNFLEDFYQENNINILLLSFYSLCKIKNIFFDDKTNDEINEFYKEKFGFIFKALKENEMMDYYI